MSTLTNTLLFVAIFYFGALPVINTSTHSSMYCDSPKAKTITLTEAHVRAVITDHCFIDNSNVIEYLTASPLAAQALIMALERSLDDYFAYVSKPRHSAIAVSKVEMKWNSKYKRNILGALAKGHKDILAELAYIFALIDAVDEFESM